MLTKGVKEKTIFEISEIDTLISEYKTLVDFCKINEPDLIYLSALAAMLHSF